MTPIILGLGAWGLASASFVFGNWYGKRTRDPQYEVGRADGWTQGFAARGPVFREMRRAARHAGPAYPDPVALMDEGARQCPNTVH